MGDFPGAPPGYNGRLSASGYGSYFVRVETIDSGLSIIATEDQSRDLRGLYTTRRTSGSFGLLLAFVGSQERDRFNRWIRGYAVRKASGATGVGAMRVQVPSRGWDKVGVPASERGPLATYGEDVGEKALRATLNFVGARDPIDLSDQVNDAVSFYVGPRSADAVDARYFYPSATQLSGEQFGASVNYDIEAEREAARAAQPSPSAAQGGARWKRPAERMGRE